MFRCREVVIIAIATIFAIFGIILVTWWPSFIETFLNEKLTLSDSGRTFDTWYQIPIPIYMHVHLFNWTNPENVRDSNIKPHFERLGPYVFREERHKKHIKFHKNYTVTYQPQSFWYFQPELSNGQLDDIITAAHVPSIAAAKKFRNKLKIIKKLFSNALSQNGGDLYQSHTAIEWLFDGFYDPFLAFALRFNTSMTNYITSDHFAWFLDRNGTVDKNEMYTVHTGRENLQDRGDLKFWNGRNHSGFFEGECGRINGSTSDLFPAKSSGNEYLTVFIKDTCRSINLKPIGKELVNGIKGLRYETQPDTFDSGHLNPNMKCFCTKSRLPNDCPKTGVTDLGPCFFDAPIYLSHANFLYADDSFTNTISGMKSNLDNDTFYIIMEPKLGVPLKVHAAVQINVLVEPDNDIKIFKGINKFYSPMFTITTYAEASEDILGEVKMALIMPSLGFYLGVALLGLTLLLFSIGIYCHLRHRNAKVKTPKSYQINS